MKPTVDEIVQRVREGLIAFDKGLSPTDLYRDPEISGFVAGLSNLDKLRAEELGIIAASTEKTFEKLRKLAIEAIMYQVGGNPAKERG